MVWYEWVSFILSILSFSLGLIAFIFSILFWKYEYKYYRARKDLRQVKQRWENGDIQEGDMNKINQDTLLLLSEHPEENNSSSLKNNPYFNCIKNMIINCNKDS